MSDLSVAAVINAKLMDLDATAAAFERMTQSFVVMRDEFRASVTDALQAFWQGEASTEAHERLGLAQTQLEAAAVEAAAIAGQLRTAHSDFTAAQRDLQNALNAVSAEGMTWEQEPSIGQWMQGGINVSWPPSPAGEAMNDAAWEHTQQTREATARRLSQDTCRGRGSERGSGAHPGRRRQR
ncbi:hypothetical protein [Yinghuangia seranimata]|uniref:hypothetical protein n=1 Tax=Yinghuangia seranimata TaxID=408067 RepID=UPI00248B0B19|nr:hypothetical protein [Yinghuangia seranimata]MDI2128199.1 hypothetical protein [Yinghuangia seranimata]